MQLRDACLGLLAVSFLLTPAPLAAQDGAKGSPPDGLRLPNAPRRSRAFEEMVNRAIDRGVVFLREQQAADGAFNIGVFQQFHIKGPDSLGPTAIGVYTLRACGAGFEDEQIKLGLARLRELYKLAKRPGSKTVRLDNYGVSLTVLALEAHYAADGNDDAKEDRYGRLAGGGRRIPDPDLAWLKELRTWLVRAQTKDGAFSYWSPAKGNQRYDYSNMQYSLLALKALRRMGIKVPLGVWQNAVEHLVKSQEKDGPKVKRFGTAGVDEDGYGGTTRREVGSDKARGWGYLKGMPATGSMTAGGVSSLVICRSELLGRPGYTKKLDAKAVRGIRDGMGWLGKNFTVKENPGARGAPALKELWHYYYLYGMERAGVMSELAFMGEHDWYLEGAMYLVDEQRDNGSWLGEDALDSLPFQAAAPEARTMNFVDTCFALLFLKRATFRVTRGAIATIPEDAELNLDGAESLDDATFATVFDAVFQRYRRTGPDDRAERSRDFVKLGKRAVPKLILHLDDPSFADRAAACNALERITGDARGYRAEATPEERGRAIAAWEKWWFLRRGGMLADVGKGRFVDAATGDK